MSDQPSSRRTSRLSGLLDRLSGHAAPGRQAPAQTQAPLAQTMAAGALPNVTPRVLLINFDLIVDPSSRQTQTLSQRRHWNRVDDLFPAFIADLQECSYGYAQYRVVERQDVDAIPVKADGFTYTGPSLLDVLDGRAKPHNPDFMDYQRIVARFNLFERITNNEIDEVWLFGFPYAGFYESRMAGSGAFWCNAPELENSQRCPRRFVMMGFNYERGVGEMLESYSHRVESIMHKVYERAQGDANLWEHFTRFDKNAPGLAEVGTVHYAPNSSRDYDWGNPRIVPSRCDDWMSYPDFTGLHRMVNCAEWGNGDIRAHHKWWLRHLPHVPGTFNGIDNNWWRYIVDPNLVRA